MKVPLHVVRDGVKWLMLPTKVLAQTVSAWPEDTNCFTITFNCFVLMSYFLFIYGNIYYIMRDDVGLSDACIALSKLSLMLETTIRRIFNLYQKRRLLKVLNAVFHEFDASDVEGPDVDLELRKESKRLFIFCAFYIASALICGMQYISTTIMSGNVPMFTSLPYSINDNPLYFGIFYCWQSFFIFEVAVHICTTDIFFACLLHNCIAQFKLLRVRMLNKFEAAPDKMLFVAKFVRQHQHLIEVCQELNSIFSFFILLQSIILTGALCLSMFIATAIPELVVSAFTDVTGHLCLLLLYCYVGNELSIHALELSDAVYLNGWHLCETDIPTMKAVAFMMVRCQKVVTVSAGGFGNLTLTNFMKTLKFAFSVYTLLNAMLEKQKAAI
ncbi:hypothetical protein PPYR_14367 [Photinus pyralis]|uniref:Odorant receptor n=2 Tax=Photinus pyralis TaxID=7054 RepID=A0A5N4A545_PHOPY|nr:odorant receptor 82a-like [Photinus pyralis]KAB0792408.1 hypothetical protein PPYR_14367 [Photinus pyralis]